MPSLLCMGYRPPQNGNSRILQNGLASFSITSIHFNCNPIHTDHWRSAFGFEYLASKQTSDLLANRGGRSPPADLLFASAENLAWIIQRRERPRLPNSVPESERKPVHPVVFPGFLQRETWMPQPWHHSMAVPHQG